MIISKNGYKYITNQFRTLDIERRLAFLECFLEKDDVFLFAHVDPDVKAFMKDLFQEDIDTFCDGFFNGYIEMYNESTKKKVEENVKEMIFQKYYQGDYNTILENDNELLKNKLLDDFKNKNYKNIDEDNIQKIKNYICFEILNEKDYETEKFINDRITFINQNNVFSDNLSERCDTVNEIKWFRIDCREELEKAVEIKEFYEVVILNINSEFDEYSYAVRFIETTTDFILEVKEGKSGDFINNIIPKISKAVPDIDLQLD